MPYCHRQRGIGALLGMQPQVSELAGLRIIGAYDHDLCAFIPRFGHEMGIGGAGLRHVRAPQHQESGVIPVRRFGHVGLFAPGLRRCGRQIAIPVVKAHADAADQRQITAAGRIRHHRHRRNRRKADNTVGAESFGRVYIGRRDDFVDFVPVGANQSAQAAYRLVFCGFSRVFDYRRPSLNRV